MIQDSPISQLSSLSKLTNDDLFLVSDKKGDRKYSSMNISYLNLTNSISTSLSSSMTSIKLVTW